MNKIFDKDNEPFQIMRFMTAVDIICICIAVIITQFITTSELRFYVQGYVGVYLIVLIIGLMISIISENMDWFVLIFMVSALFAAEAILMLVRTNMIGTLAILFIIAWFVINKLFNQKKKRMNDVLDYCMIAGAITIYLVAWIK